METGRLEEVEVKSFCLVIEVKGHDSRDVEFRGKDVWVPYRGELSSATDQSESQKYSFLNFLRFAFRIEKTVACRSAKWMHRLRCRGATRLEGPAALT